LRQRLVFHCCRLQGVWEFQWRVLQVHHRSCSSVTTWWWWLIVFVWIDL
jgi:hypothetical protein